MTIDQQIAAARRELKLRMRVYPRWVASGRMKAEAMDHETNAMAAIVVTLEAVKARTQPELKSLDLGI